MRWTRVASVGRQKPRFRRPARTRRPFRAAGHSILAELRQKDTGRDEGLTRPVLRGARAAVMSLLPSPR